MRVLGTNGEMAEVQPPKQLAHAAFVEGDAELGRDAVTQIGAPEPHDAVAGEIGAFLDPARNLALLDPAQACRPAASRPVSKPIQPCLIVAVNPVAQCLPVHAAKPRRFLAAETIERHGNGQHARCLLGIRRSLGRRAQIRGAHVRSSNRNPSHLHPSRINADSIDSQNSAERNPPVTS